MGKGIRVGRHSSVVLSTEQNDALDTDALHRLRAWSPVALHDQYHKYGIPDRVWGQLVAGSASITHLPNESAAKLTVTAADGDSATLRTHTFFRYQSGRGLGIRVTGYHSSDAAISIVRRSYVTGAVVEETIAQADWNGDSMNGGPNTAFDVDTSKGNLYGFDIAWLGVGNVRCNINSVMVHEFKNQNTIAGPYMTTAVLPITFQIVNSGAIQYRRWGYFDDQNGIFFQTASTRAAGSITNICSSVWSDGGETAEHRYSFAALGAIIQPGITTQLPLIAIRPKLTFNSITNRALVFPVDIDVLNEIRASSIRVFMNPTSLTGGSWVSAGANSAVEYNSTASATAGGELIHAGFAQIDSALSADVAQLFSPLGRVMRLDYSGAVQDTLVVTGLCEGTGQQTSDIRACISWLESR